MEAVNYLKNSQGKTTGLFINLQNKKKFSQAMLEEIEDAISYELRKDSEKITLEELKSQLGLDNA